MSKKNKEGDVGEKSSDSINQRKTVIQIPSCQEVLHNAQQKSTPSLFEPSQSFSQAFSFIKNSEFYEHPKATSLSSFEGVAENATIMKNGQPSVAIPSSSSAASVVSQSGQNRNAILVSHRQKGNPLLKHIRNVRWDFADIICDYLLGQNSCALYISLRYHLLHPDYLYYRIRELQKKYKLCVVLCHVDVDDVVKPLLEVTKTSLLHDCTLLCGWSLEECGRYLETIKMYENKPADLIQGQMDTDYLSRLSHVLTTVRHVNKTDVVTLGSTFGSLSNIMDASMEDLARCPGIGERKVRRLYDAFHEPFRRRISTQVPAPEMPSRGATRTADEITKIDEHKEGGSSAEKKGKQELTVKSALAIAISKHGNKLRKPPRKSLPIADCSDRDE